MSKPSRLIELVPVPSSTPLGNTLANRVKEYLELSKHMAKDTYDGRRMCLENFLIFVNGRYVDRELINKWYEWDSNKGNLPNTTYKHVTLIKAFFNWCEQNEYIASSPIRHIKMKLVPPSTLPAIYTEEEYQRIKDATIGKHLYFMTVIGYRTGMSMIDVCHLRWPCVDLENLYIHTNRLKTVWRGIGSQFWVPIIANSDLHGLLSDLKAQHVNRFGNTNDDYVHPELQGMHKWGHSRLSVEYKTMLNRLGIKGKTFKNWRNTFMSHVANSGGNMGLAVRLTAHADPTVYAQYIRPDIEALRTIVQNAFQWAESKQTIKQLRETNT